MLDPLKTRMCQSSSVSEKKNDSNKPDPNKTDPEKINLLTIFNLIKKNEEKFEIMTPAFKENTQTLEDNAATLKSLKDLNLPLMKKTKNNSISNDWRFLKNYKNSISNLSLNINLYYKFSNKIVYER